MGKFDLNLSTRPFKPYRAANFGLLILLLVLIAVSAGQFLSYQDFSSKAAVSRQIEQEVKANTDRLSSDLQKLNAKMTSGNATAKLSEVELLNQLLVRKSFSWTRVFANLEKVMPENVRLLSLRPFLAEDGRIGLTMDIRGRSLNDANVFLRTLEDSEIFSEVALAVQENIASTPSTEVEFALSAFYTPPESKPPASGNKPQGKVANQPEPRKAAPAPPASAQSKVVVP